MKAGKIAVAFLCAASLWASGARAASTGLYTFKIYAPGILPSGPAAPAAPPTPPLTPATFNASSTGCLYPSFSADLLTYSCASTSTGLLYPLVSMTAPKAAGKWYWEVKLATSSSYASIGVIKTPRTGNYVGQSTGDYGYFSTGGLYNSAQNKLTANSFTGGDTVSVMMDLDNLTIAFSKNCGTPYTYPAAMAAGTYYGAVSSYYNQSTTFVLNAGQSAFKCPVPDGYTALGQ